MVTTLEQDKPIVRKDAFSRRVHEVDFIRGALILLVVIDHLFLHFMNLGVKNEITWMADFFTYYRYMPAHIVIQKMVLMAFVFISGVSCAFSKNNWKRAGLMLLFYAALLILTNLIDASGVFQTTKIRIDFNIIAVIAWSTLIYCFIQNRSWRIPAAMALAFFIFSFYFLEALKKVPGMEEAYVPFLWRNPNIVYGDFMPLFPYIGYYFLGVLCSLTFYKDRKSIVPFKGEWERPICFLGRHSMIVYIGHQAILTPIFEIINAII